MSGTAEPKRPRIHLPGVRAAKPLLAPEAERLLTDRQRQVLSDLGELVVRGGLAELTMAEIAAKLNCSLRTLYGIAPSKDELLLVVVDRRLQRIGRRAMEALQADMPPLEALRLYLGTVNEAVRPTTVEFAKDFAGVRGARRLLDDHEGYVIAVTRSLLERAVEAGQIPAVDTAAVAHVLGSLGRDFSRPDVMASIADSPSRTADAVTEILLRGLEVDSNQPPASGR